MKKQARFNGEIGANGKSYQKGQFIAEQEVSATSASNHQKGKRSGKQEISPYVWEVPEDPEMKSIYSFIQGVYGDLSSGIINEQAISFYDEDVKKIESLMKRYQAGERWYFPSQEMYI